MKVSKLFYAASLFAIVKAQDTTTTDTTDTLSTSTTDTSDALVTLPPEICPTAGLESCYNIIQILTPTVYVILTVTGSIPASLSGEETITSGDPIFTQTDNIATGTDEVAAPPTTAVVRISYSESDGTTCDEATVTSTLTEPEDPQCPVATSVFGTPPPQATKTRVFVKEREDDTQSKGGDGGGGSSENPTSPTAIPGGNTDTGLPVDTGSPATPTEEPAPGSTEEVPTSETPEPTGTIPTDTIPAGGASATTSSTDASEETSSSDSTSTDSNSTPTTTDSPTTLLTSSTAGSDGESSSSGYTGETGKDELSTSFTTIAEVSSGVTNFVTKPIATLTGSSSTASTSPGPLTGAAGANFALNAEALFGVFGLAAVLGL
ncbi:hypothetical protein ABW19_dt0207973 [Dactylella cylindrospora]|nr:hypothetical protein ABW19_dt0207973 [Dactylella cylindrospora]